MITKDTSTTASRTCNVGLKRLQGLLHDRDLRPFRCTSGVVSATRQKDCCNHTRQRLDGWSLVLYHNREIENLVEFSGPVLLVSSELLTLNLEYLDSLLHLVEELYCLCTTGLSQQSSVFFWLNCHLSVHNQNLKSLLDLQEERRCL